MGYYCTVPQCTSLAGKTKNVKFHRFPRDVTMADRWNDILKRGKPYTKYSKVCSLHFTQSDYNVTTMGQWKTLSKDAVPSQNLPKLNPDGSVMVIRKSRTVKYKESRKDEQINSDKSEKWTVLTHTPASAQTLEAVNPPDAQDSNVTYRLQTLSAIASTLSPQPQNQIPIPNPIPKPKKQDAYMQTDPVQSEDDDLQPNNSYSETSENSYNSEHMDYYKETNTSFKETEPIPNYKEMDYKETEYQKDKEYLYVEKERDQFSMPSYKETKFDVKSYESPKDYTKNDDYMPQTNEEYNKEAEKYALERKSLNGYEKMPDAYQKVDQYKVVENGYQKIPDVYNNFEKDYQNRNGYIGYENPYPDSVEVLRNQQHNLQILQQQHRLNENQNFFNENHIKQEIDLNGDDEKFLYERTKEQLDASMYTGHRNLMQQQRLIEHIQHQVKQEPDVTSCENVLQPQGSPYYTTTNGHNNVSNGYYEQLSRPGPELLIAKQNALAAHTQLWQNTMKRPFFYSESTHYPSTLYRHEDLTRILQ